MFQLTLKVPQLCSNDRVITFVIAKVPKETNKPLQLILRNPHSHGTARVTAIPITARLLKHICICYVPFETYHVHTVLGTIILSEDLLAH